MQNCGKIVKKIVQKIVIEIVQKIVIEIVKNCAKIDLKIGEKSLKQL